MRCAPCRPKRTILVRHLLSEVEIETIRVLVNHPPAATVEPLENAANEVILEPVIEDNREKRGRCHYISGEVVYSHHLGLRSRADALPEENIAVPDNLQCLQRNFNLYGNSER